MAEKCKLEQFARETSEKWAKFEYITISTIRVVVIIGIGRVVVCFIRIWATIISLIIGLLVHVGVTAVIIAASVN